MAVGHSMLGEVIVDHQGMATVVADMLSYGATAVGGYVLHWSGLRGTCGYDHGVVHCAILSELVHDLGYGGSLLSDGNIDAGDIAPLLVEDRIDHHRRLSGLAVSNDQLTLSPANGYHRIDSLEPCLERLFNGLTGHDSWGLEFDPSVFCGLNGSSSIDGFSEGIDDSPDEGLAHRYLGDFPGTLCRISLFDEVVFTKE